MTQYFAFLRAINVGGHRIIRMEKLREMFSAMGFRNVQTYIQSGNVSFEAEETDEAALRLTIEKQIQDTFGFQVDTFLRTVPELEAIVQNNPFPDVPLSKSREIYVTFLHEDPATDKRDALAAAGSNEYEHYAFISRDVYTLLHKDAPAKLLFSNMFIEKKLKQPSTGRNWNTVVKMLDYKQIKP